MVWGFIAAAALTAGSALYGKHEQEKAMENRPLQPPQPGGGMRPQQPPMPRMSPSLQMGLDGLQKRYLGALPLDPIKTEPLL